jgi:prevent-host-death family protein
LTYILVSYRIKHMENTVISMREIQRNYKKILQEAKKKGTPVFLGAHGKAQAVLMDIEEFERLESKGKREKEKKKWEELKRELDYLAQQGRQDVDLVEFLRKDRQSH